MFQTMPKPSNGGGSEPTYSSYIEENVSFSGSAVVRTIPNNKTKNDVVAIAFSVTYNSGNVTDSVIYINENGTFVYSSGTNSYTPTFTSDTQVSIANSLSGRTSPIIWLLKE